MPALETRAASGAVKVNSVMADVHQLDVATGAQVLKASAYHGVRIIEASDDKAQVNVVE